MANKPKFWDNFLSSIQTNAVAVAVVVIVLMMFVPTGKDFISIAMVLNLAIAFVILLTVIYTPHAADFSSFPRVILLVTLFGLAVNISSTKLILTANKNGAEATLADQSVMVKTFADIVAGDNIVVGFIIFIVIIVVQVVVITKGASRVSEVSARFTLDSMNNKMFDIQNELNSGAITEEEAKRQKAQIRKEIDFYSAMDGSSKFVSGNVKVGIFITALNFVGGIVTGMVTGKMGFMEALNTYAKLTIGDGLMSQLPSLMLSFATGLLVTGGSTSELIGDQLKKEFSINGVIYIIVGGALAVMGVAFHNKSSFILLPIGGCLMYMGYRLQQMEKVKLEKQMAETQVAKTAKQGAAADDISPIVTLDPLSLDLGYALIPLVEEDKGAELLERIMRIRREAGLDMGIVLPKIHIRDNMSIDPNEYSFKIRGIEAGRSKIHLGYYMCMLKTGASSDEHEITGEKTKDPAFGMDAVWIPEEKRAEAEKAGYAVVDPPTIIATHITEIIRTHAADILSRQEVSTIIAKVKETDPVAVDEVLSGDHKFTYGEIELVLKNLLSEQVSIRNMVKILETIADFASITRDPWLLTEKVREALGLQICLQYADENKILHVLTISQPLANKIIEHRVVEPGSKPFVAFDPVDGRKFISAMSSTVAAARDRRYLPIILCPAEVRQLVKSATEREIPGLVVLSVNEVVNAGNEIKLETIGEIDE